MSAVREAFIEELKDIYDAENQLLKALPKMAEAARNERLRASFQQHAEETRKQIWRLGEIFEAFDEEIAGKHCKGMKGLIKEAEDIIDEEEGDAALIAAAQKAEHYEIAAYGTLASWAVALGHEEVLGHLQAILGEEKATDKKLTTLAQTTVNAAESWRDETPKPAPRRKAPRRSLRPKAAARKTSRTKPRAASPRSKRRQKTGA